VSDAILLGIFNYCGFFHATKKYFPDTVFETFIRSQNLPIELTRYTKKPCLRFCSRLAILRCVWQLLFLEKPGINPIAGIWMITEGR
jgi:hypothetical protein